MNKENQHNTESTYNRTLKKDITSWADRIDSKMSDKTEAILRKSGKIALGTTALAVATGIVGVAYNETGPKTEVGHTVEYINTEIPTNTAIGTIEQGINDLAAENNLSADEVDDLTEDIITAGNKLTDARYMVPGTGISITLDKKPLFGYEVDASTLKDPIGTPQTYDK